MNCFSCWNIDGVTAVKIVLSKHSQKGKANNHFIAEVKGLVGINQQITSFISTFSEKINKYGYSIPNPKVVLEEENNFFEELSEN